MKKILSLMLAGLMMFALAGSVFAETCTSSLANTDNSYVYETILGKNWYYWYLLNNYYNGGCYKPGTGTGTTTDTIDPGFGVTPDMMFPTNSYVSCPTKLADDKTCGKSSQVFYSTSDGLTYKTYAYCSEHGMFEVTSTSLKPILPSATYTITTSAGIGGSISISNATNNFGTYSVKCGDSVTISVVPEYGYVIEGVYLNGYYMGNEETLTLDSVRCNLSVRAVFRKIDVTRKYTITASASEGGNVYAVVNNNSVGKFTSLIGTYADTVTLRFVPAGENYKVESVTINGVNMGAISYYEVGRMSADMVVKATFTWDCPYTDVAKEHLAAVEYVSEIDVMGSPNKYLNTDKFEGTKSVTVRAMACYLAELADVNDELDTVADRVAWATKKGLVGEKESLNVEATWSRAGDMLNTFVRNLEKDGNVVFTDLVNANTAYDVVSKMGLVTEVAYKVDGKITRYDMAEMCYGVSLLKTK